MMGQELDKRLDENKYEMWEALKLYQEHQQGTSGHYCWKCAEAINKVLSQIEGER